jgi:SNF2 family DNA or RNA helicase
LSIKECDENQDEYFRNTSNPKPEDEKNDNFFDLVYEIHKNDNVLTIWDEDDIDRIQDRSCLRPDLRPYQINGIKWMLKKEGFKIESELAGATLARIEDDDDLHPLYSEIVSETSSQKLYYHNYFGLFSRDRPTKKKSLPGGILADEMGLGKT